MKAAEIVKATIRIAAAPAEVFPYLVEPSLIVQWIGTWADLNPEPGGVFAIDFPNTQARGEYVCVEPPDRVVFTWGIPGNEVLPPGTSTVEILLKADGDETIVELTHRNLPPDMRASHREGWEECLEALRKTFNS
jgi:uncharacterized protein YndB with AHSA1/START domain